MGFISFIGRTALVLVFIIAGIDKFVQIDKTVDSMKQQGLTQHTLELAYAAATLEVVAGLAVIANIKQTFFASLLVLFLIPATYFYHTDFTNVIQTIMFMKNVAIAGGLLLLVDRPSHRPINTQTKKTN